MSAALHRLSVADNLKYWMIMIPLLKNTTDQGSVWGMVQRERVLQGVRRPAGPVLHTPVSTPGRENEKLYRQIFAVTMCGDTQKDSILFYRYAEKRFSPYLWDEVEERYHGGRL